MTTINNRHNNEDLDPFAPKNMHLSQNDSQDSDNDNTFNTLPSGTFLDEEWRNQRDAYVALKRSGSLETALQAVRDAEAYFSQYLTADDYRLTFIQYDLADYSMEHARATGGSYLEAIQALEKIAPELEQLFTKESFMYAYSQFKLSLCYLYSGKVSEGSTLFETSVALLIHDVEHGDTDPTLVSSCYRQYGDYLKERHKLQDSLHAYERGLAILRSADTPDKSALSALQHLSQGVLDRLSVQWKQAPEETLQEVLNAPQQSIHAQCLASRLLMQRHYDAGNAQAAYYAAARTSGFLYREASLPREQLQAFYTLYAKVILEYAGVPSTYEQLRKLEERYGSHMRDLGEFTPDPHEFWYGIAQEYYTAERYELASTTAAYLVKRTSELSGPYSMKAYYASVLHTACLRQSGSPDEYEYAARKSAAIAEQALTETSDEYITSRLMASRVCSMNSNLTEALVYADQAETALLRQSVRDYGLMLDVYENLALQHFSNGNTEEAHEALSECKQILGQARIDPERRARIFLHDAIFAITEENLNTAHTQLLEARALIEHHNLSDTDTMVYYLSARTQYYRHEGSPEALDKAQDYAEEALSRAQQLYGYLSLDTVGQMRDLAGVLQQRAQLYHDQDAAMSALEYYLEAVALYKEASLETYAHVRLLQTTLEVLEFLHEEDEPLYTELSQRRESIQTLIDLKNDPWGEADTDDLD